MSPDPLVQHPFNSQNYNRYSYCINNPLKYIDPSGYGFFKWLLGTIGVITYPVMFIVSLPDNLIEHKNIFSSANDWYRSLRDGGQNIDNKFSWGSNPSNPNKTSIGGNNNYSSPYQKQDGDVLIPNFPNNQTPQTTSGTCFTTSMEYLSIFYGGKYRNMDYALWYMKTYNDMNFLTGGVTSEARAEATLSNFFSTNKISSVTGINSAIDNGNPVMANIYIGTEYQNNDLSKPVKEYHNVVVVGYNSTNQTYIVMDPATGTYARMNESKFDPTDPNGYLFQVTGIKP